MGMHKSGRNDVKTPGASTSQEKKLGEYIERKQEAYGIPVSQRNQESVKTTIPERQLQPLNRAKKMTFEEWAKREFSTWFIQPVPGTPIYESCHNAWKAAQENMS